MKKVLFIASLLAIVAQSCTKEDSQNVVAEQKTTIEVVADLGDETRTYYDGDNIKWAESGEQLNIIYYADDNSSSRRQTATHTDYTIDAEGRILFTADFTTTDGATSYTLGAFYPYAYKSTTSSISLTVPQMQTPTADSYAPATDILVSKEPVTIEGTPESVKFTFARMVAFAKMTLKGIGAGETIEMSVQNWYYCLNGLAATENQAKTYNWGEGFAPVEARLMILSALEELTIKESRSVMLIADGGGSFLGAKFSYFSEDEHTFMGFGGMRYMEVNYTDAEWADFVAQNNNDLSEEYKKSE